MSIISSILNLIYPNLCEVCDCSLVKGEQVLCLSCLNDMPFTDFWVEKHNEVEKIFWGKVNIDRACSLFYFKKGSAYRKLIHSLKYSNRPDIGKKLGKELGYKLKSSGNYSSIDYIVPVPIHKTKRRKRGYNQSECIAEGISEVMNIPLMTSNLIKVLATETQTRKNRIERQANITGSFAVKHADILKRKNVLLVDDIITTGATIELCASVLIETCKCNVSITSVGYAPLNS